MPFNKLQRDFIETVRGRSGSYWRRAAAEAPSQEVRRSYEDIVVITQTPCDQFGALMLKHGAPAQREMLTLLGDDDGEDVV